MKGTGWGSGAAMEHVGELRKNELKSAFAAAFPHTVPVLTGFLFLGIAYGVLMQTQGFGVGWSLLMSLVAYCGSMQFVAIALLASGFAPMQAFLLSIMVNARHLFYGISMLEKYKGLGKIRAFLIFALCDETFSISYATEPPAGVSRKYYYFAVTFLNYAYWAVGTVLGGLLGNMLTFDTRGLDFVLTALYVVLFLEQWKKPENRRAAAAGVACTVCALVLFGPERFIIPAMLMILAVLTAGRRVLSS